jgi:hypothetical protein
MGNVICSNCKRNGDIDLKSQLDCPSVEEKGLNNSETKTNSVNQDLKLKSKKPIISNNLIEEQKKN